MEVKQITLKIFLKSKKMPIVAIVSDEKYINDLLFEVNSLKDYVKFGDIIFKKSDFIRCEIRGK